jgi:predicted DNA-binding protein YlxM (UPF0122 family)
MAKVTEEQIRQMHQMLEQGMSVRGIARALNIPRTTLQEHCAKNVKLITSTPKVETKPVKTRKPHVRLTEDQIIDICLKLNAGKNQTEIAKEYDVCNVAIHDIAVRKTHREISSKYLSGYTDPRKSSGWRLKGKLSVKDIRAIRNLVAYYSTTEYSFLKVNCSVLAQNYGVSNSTMSNLIKGKTHKGV